MYICRYVCVLMEKGVEKQIINGNFMIEDKFNNM